MHSYGLFIGDPYIANDMVIQKNALFEIRGEDKPHAEIQISIFDKLYQTKVNESGHFQISIGPFEGGLVGSLNIQGTTSITCERVRVGEVWVLVGQSNMALPFEKISGHTKLKEKYSWGQVFILNEPFSHNKKHFGSGIWRSVTPKNIDSFSGVGISFAHFLSQEINIPVGIIICARGTSKMKHWFPNQMNGNKEVFQRIRNQDKNSLDAWGESLFHYQEWKKQFGFFEFRNSRSLPLKPELVGDLYHGMLNPYTSKKIAGLIYYQGESDIHEVDSIAQLLPELIHSYRIAWSQSDLPFILIQLPGWDFNRKRSFGEILSEVQQNSILATFRDMQFKATEQIPNAEMVVAMDLGEKDDVHPENKIPLGFRLAQAAAEFSTHKYRLWRGPRIQTDSIRKENKDIIFHYDHIGNGLQTKGDRIIGFTAAKDDGVFFHAEAKIEGHDSIRLEMNGVGGIVYLRYGWKDYPLANLTDSTGNPAAPFQIKISDGF